MRKDKRVNARKQRGIYAVNMADIKPVTDRKARREESKRQKKIAKKDRKAEKKNQMQIENDGEDNSQDIQTE